MKKNNVIIEEPPHYIFQISRHTVSWKSYVRLRPYILRTIRYDRCSFATERLVHVTAVTFRRRAIAARTSFSNICEAMSDVCVRSLNHANILSFREKSPRIITICNVSQAVNIFLDAKILPGGQISSGLSMLFKRLQLKVNYNEHLGAKAKNRTIYKFLAFFS